VRCHSSRRFLKSYIFFFTRSIPGVFQHLHNFNIAEIGTVFMALLYVFIPCLFPRFLTSLGQGSDRYWGSSQIFTKNHYTSLFESIIERINLNFLGSRRYFPTRGPEARLYLACFAAVMLPAGMFTYAWSSFIFVNWIALTIGITLFIWATFIMYLAVFSYLADWCATSLHASD
jgi:hypothetical protein